MKLFKNKYRASSLIIAITSIAAISVITYSVIDMSTTGRRLSKKAESTIVGGYNIYSLMEYGLSQMANRLGSAPAVNASEFITRPLDPPSTTLFPQDGGIFVRNVELKGGIIPPPVQKYIDPNDPLNINDSDKGATVSLRSVLLLGHIEQEDSSNNNTDVYGMGIFEIRDRPVLSNAIFCNGDLIILKPNPPMLITGPTHTNGNLILCSLGGVSFNGLVTAAGMLQVMPPYGEVNFRSGGTDESPIYEAINSPYTGTDWQGYALDRWKGYLQTREMGIAKQQPFGFETTMTSLESNPYHKIIEPPLTADNANINPQTEAAKFGSKAGLVIKIKITKKTNNYTTYEFDRGLANYYVFGPSGIISGDPYNIARIDHPDPTTWDTPLPPKSYFLSTNPANYNPPPNKDISSSDAAALMFGVTRNDYNVTVVEAYRYVESGGGDYYRQDDSGQLKRYKRELINIPGLYNTQNGADPSAIVRSQSGWISPQEVAQSIGMWYFKNCSYSNQSDLLIWQQAANYYIQEALRTNGLTTPWIAPNWADPGRNLSLKMWDARRRKYLHMTDIDIGNLKKALDTGNIPDWNGIVYIECDDLDRTGVRLVNANVVPSRNDQGFTIATNNALYIMGHFNADGDFNTGSSTAVDSNNEVPAAIAADAITVLSNYWDDRYSRNDVTRFAYIPNQNDRNFPQETEISAALIAGTDIYNSGGINNFVRYLEMWENKRVRIRGALIALFTSEVAWEPLTLQYTYYPPIRDIGYSDLFKNRKYPPGTPLIRTFRKTFQKRISGNQYADLLSLINRSANNPNFQYSDYYNEILDIDKKYNRTVTRQAPAPDAPLVVPVPPATEPVSTGTPSTGSQQFRESLVE